ncbi:unnamed protein product [Ectocarpus sp. CCAP 1310/34]|nr:unnamed protein product [Ectocarpus sp. CCAP 1310/34]
MHAHAALLLWLIQCTADIIQQQTRTGIIPAVQNFSGLPASGNVAKTFEPVTRELSLYAV